VSEQARHDAQAAERAQRALLEFQERFVAVLGHDLRNPLSAVSMAAGLLAQRAAQVNDDNTSRVVARIASSTRRMARMVEQIMDLSRTRLGGGFAVAPAPVELCAMLSGIIDELRTVHPSRTILLRGASTLGVWDRDRLEQVFSNLLGNALAYGVATAPIIVTTHLHADTVRVEVHNAGPPISESLRAQLFDPFRRGERTSRETKTSGLGLGLYISRELIVAHGGDLTVSSDAASGTIFCVTLPRSSKKAALQ
jgi:signal transduction histidine kinase